MWTKEKIKQLLTENDRAVERALLALLARQTSDEVQSESTSHHNGKGFCTYDARMMTSMAKWVRRGHQLSVNQLLWLRGSSRNGTPRIGKYAGQLAKVANEKEDARLAV